MENIWLSPIRIKYRETEELRNIHVMEFFTDNTRVRSLCRHQLWTLGDVLDNWNKLIDLNGFGKESCKHAKASIFAYMCELGLVDMKQTIEFVERGDE